MQSTGTFLGLTHDLSSINQTGHVQFWARERLHDKVRDMLATARVTGHFSRGAASKLYGLANFLEQGIYGRVGYGGLMAIKARQDETTSTITPEIEACFEVIEAVMRFQPKREFPVLHLDHLRFLAASDAAVEADNPGSGGFHLIFFQPDGSQIRHSFVATNCAELRTLWQPAETHIAQLELSMVLYALVERPDLFRNRHGLWFLDNVAAVMTLVRGRSSNADLAKLGHLIHLALFALRAQGYWEYVQSKSNWADDISRLGVNDPWWRCHGFEFLFVVPPYNLVPATLCSCHSHLRIPLVLWELSALGDSCRAGSSLGCQAADQWRNWSGAMYVSHRDDPKQT